MCGRLMQDPRRFVLRQRTSLHWSIPFAVSADWRIDWNWLIPRPPYLEYTLGLQSYILRRRDWGGCQEGLVIPSFRRYENGGVGAYHHLHVTPCPTTAPPAPSTFSCPPALSAPRLQRCVGGLGQGQACAQVLTFGQEVPCLGCFTRAAHGSETCRAGLSTALAQARIEQVPRFTTGLKTTWPGGFW